MIYVRLLDLLPASRALLFSITLFLKSMQTFDRESRPIIGEWVPKHDALVSHVVIMYRVSEYVGMWRRGRAFINKHFQPQREAPYVAKNGVPPIVG